MRNLPLPCLTRAAIHASQFLATRTEFPGSQETARAEDLVFLSIAFHTIPYACITKPTRQHTAHTQTGSQSAARKSMHGARQHSKSPHGQGTEPRAPRAQGQSGRLGR